MSLSVNSNNPFASVQSLWQQGSAASGTQTPSDPLSGLLAALGQQGAGGASSTAGATSTGSSAAISGSTSPQFDPRTLQALLALQTNGANAQSLASQFDSTASGGDPLSALGSQQSDGQHGHHHHHHMATSGSTESSANAASAGSSPSAGGATTTGNNLFEQLTQMQAQLVIPAVAQSIATA